jgi:hypothetical protein
LPGVLLGRGVGMSTCGALSMRNVCL